MQENLGLVHIEDADINRMQQGIVNKINQLGSVSIMNGAQLSGISLQAGSNEIQHKLKRKLQGYIVTKQMAASNIYFVSSSDSTLVLSASAPAIIDLWVY